jgi:hypothetical protein
MTVDDVAEAVRELESEGRHASANMVVVWLQQHGTPATKRVVLRHLHALGAIEKREKRVVIRKMIPADPVAMAQAQLTDAESALETTRAAMQEATMELMLSQGYIYMGTRYGSWLPSDPELDGVVKAAMYAQDSYRRSMSEWERSRDQLAHANLKHRRERQERHVHVHQPELLQKRDHWQYQVQHATSDRMFAEAKKNLQQATFDYERAVATAPTGESS